ncbi:MAG: class I SAM-dependent methyltransferase [Candidatus Kapaibacterium sp.]
MEQALEQIRDQQRETWNKSSPGWDKWDEFTMDFLRPMGAAIIAKLRLKDSDTVLDVATGTGEPGLTIAGIVKSGKVIGTDLSDGMLSIARAHAANRGIHNFETQAADVSELPFADNTFDAISCRFGFMFFPDMLLAAKEMARVLKPGGRIATSIWTGPEDNQIVSAITVAINEVMQIPRPPAGAPGLFRCAAPGMIEDLFRESGLKNIATQEMPGIRDFHSKEMYWNYMTEVVGPVVAALSKASAEQKEQIRSKLFQSIDELNPSGGAKLHYAARIISAEK